MCYKHTICVTVEFKKIYFDQLEMKRNNEPIEENITDSRLRP